MFIECWYVPDPTLGILLLSTHLILVTVKRGITVICRIGKGFQKVQIT